MKEFDYSTALSHLEADDLGIKIVAYSDRKELPLDSAIDDAYTGHLGGDVAAYAAALPDFMVEREATPLELAGEKYAAACAMANQAMDALASRHVDQFRRWSTNEADGIDIPPAIKAELVEAQAKCIEILRPLAEAAGRPGDHIWNVSAAAAVKRALAAAGR